MDFVSGLVVYLLLWWWVFLMSLPFGVRAGAAQRCWVPQRPAWAATTLRRVLIAAQRLVRSATLGKRRWVAPCSWILDYPLLG